MGNKDFGRKDQKGQPGQQQGEQQGMQDDDRSDREAGKPLQLDEKGDKLHEKQDDKQHQGGQHQQGGQRQGGQQQPK